jgi:hypothetical protein
MTGAEDHLREKIRKVEALCFGAGTVGEPKWAALLAPEDCRRPTPLIDGHVSPYGRFGLDPDSRVDFGRKQAA